MRRYAQIWLVLCLTVTLAGLGAARGTVEQAGQIVLCTGHGIVVIDDPTSPFAKKTQICPDMALSWLMAGFTEPPTLPPRDGGFIFAGIADDFALVSRAIPAAKARDPPLSFLL